MPKMTDAQVNEVLSGWLSGSEHAHGLTNPAGPLYVGGAETESSLTDTDFLLFTGCSACTASRPVYCC